MQVMHYTQYLLSGDITLYSKLSEAIPCGECAVNFLLLYICLSSHLLARLLAPKAHTITAYLLITHCSSTQLYLWDYIL